MAISGHGVSSSLINLVKIWSIIIVLYETLKRRMDVLCCLLMPSIVPPSGSFDSLYGGAIRLQTCYKAYKSLAVAQLVQLTAVTITQRRSMQFNCFNPLPGRERLPPCNRKKHVGVMNTEFKCSQGGTCKNPFGIS